LQSASDRPPAIWVDDLWVTFRASREGRPTLRNKFVGLHRRNERKQAMLVEALRGVSFEVPTGAVYGVIGRNGAGKTTLLRCIAGILPPTAGRVVVWGHVTPLLSLGIGFNRELTGRENILLGGLTVGLTGEEVRSHFEEIEDFAGLGGALDFPMRTYSSGMFGRLAFSLAAHLNPEILLIDEALAAGDAAFKLKCMEKIQELCERDCTVLIVSHGLEVVKMLAEHCIWLDRGEVCMDSPASDAIAAYFAEEDIEDTSATALEDV
jgi:ABC-type polysaccharide/polyol phosphate transport system ATPase subunit